MKYIYAFDENKFFEVEEETKEWYRGKEVESTFKRSFSTTSKSKNYVLLSSSAEVNKAKEIRDIMKKPKRELRGGEENEANHE